MERLRDMNTRFLAYGVLEVSSHALVQSRTAGLANDFTFYTRNNFGWY